MKSVNLSAIELREFSPDLGLSLDQFTFEACNNNAISQENAQRLRLFGENILSASNLELLDSISDDEEFICAAPQPIAAAVRVVHDFFPGEAVRFKPGLGARWLTRTVWTCENQFDSQDVKMQSAPKYALACVIGRDEIDLQHSRGLVVLSNPKKDQALTMATPNWPGLLTDDWYNFTCHLFRLGSGRKNEALGAIKFNFELSLFEPSCDRRDFYSSVFSNYRNLGLLARIPNTKYKFGF